MIRVDLSDYPRWVDHARPELRRVMSEYHLADLDRLQRFMKNSYDVDVLVTGSDPLGTVYMREQDYFFFALKWS